LLLRRGSKTGDERRWRGEVPLVLRCCAVLCCAVLCCAALDVVLLLPNRKRRGEERSLNLRDGSHEFTPIVSFKYKDNSFQQLQLQRT